MEPSNPLYAALFTHFYEIAKTGEEDPVFRKNIDCVGKSLGLPDFDDPCYVTHLEQHGFTFAYVDEPAFPPKSVVFGKLVPPPVQGSQAKYIMLADEHYRGIHPGYIPHWDYTINTVWCGEHTIVDVANSSTRWKNQLPHFTQFWNAVNGNDAFLVIDPYGALSEGYMRVHAEELVLQAHEAGQPVCELTMDDLSARINADYFTAILDLASRLIKPSRYNLSDADFCKAYQDSLHSFPSAALLINLLHPIKENYWQPEQHKRIRDHILGILHRNGFTRRDYVRPTPARISECIRLPSVP